MELPSPLLQRAYFTCRKMSPVNSRTVVKRFCRDSYVDRGLTAETQERVVAVDPRVWLDSAVVIVICCGTSFTTFTKGTFLIAIQWSRTGRCCLFTRLPGFLVIAERDLA